MASISIGCMFSISDGHLKKLYSYWGYECGSLVYVDNSNRTGINRGNGEVHSVSDVHGCKIR